MRVCLALCVCARARARTRGREACDSVCHDVVVTKSDVSLCRPAFCFSFGVLFSGLLDDPDLNANRSTGSWVGSVAAGMMLVVCTFQLVVFLSQEANLVGFAAIPVGHLIQPYGCRKLACLGSILTSAGLFISSVVPSLFWLYVSYGVLVGAGFSFSFAPAVNAVAQYVCDSASMHCSFDMVRRFDR